VAWSPDGKLVVSSDGVRDATTLQKLSGFPAELFMDGTNAAFSPDGKKLCVSTSYRDQGPRGFLGPGSSDIRVWDMSNLRSPRLSVLKSVLGFSGTFAFTPDSTLLATVDGSRRISFWDLTALPLKLKRTLIDTTPVEQIAFAGKTNILLTNCAEPRGLHAWDLTMKPPALEKFTITGCREVIAISADGTKIAEGARTADIQGLRLWVFRLGTKDQTATVLNLSGDELGITGLAFSSDARTLFAGTRAGNIFRCDLGDEKPAPKLLIQDARRTEPQAHRVGLHEELQFALRADDKRIATVGRADHTIRIWSIELDPPRRVSPSSSEDQWLYKHGVFQGPYLVAARLQLQADGGDPTNSWDFQVLDTRQKPLTIGASLMLESEQVARPEVSVSADGKLLAEVGFDRKIRIWERVAKHFRQRYRLPLDEDGRACSCRFWSGGNLFGTWGEQAEIYDFKQPFPERLMTMHEPIDHNTSERYIDGKWAPGGKVIALSKVEGGVSLWQVDSGKPHKLGEVPRNCDHGFCFLSDTSCVSVKTAGKDAADREVFFWELGVAGPKLSRKLVIRSAGEWAGFNSKRDTMLFWTRKEIVGIQSRTGRTSFRFELPGPAEKVVASDDGDLVAVVNGNGTLSLYCLCSQ
jgi:WD40 repeat protein